MIVAAAVYVFGRVCDVEHLVKDDVFDHISRYVGRIERRADRNVIVRRVVVAEDAIGFAGGPRQNGLFDRVTEIVAVYRFEDLVEVICPAFRSGDDLSAPGTFAVSGAFADHRRSNVCRIDLAGTGRDLFSKQLTDQNVCEAFVTCQGHFGAYRTDTDISFAVAQPDRMIYANIRVK